MLDFRKEKGRLFAEIKTRLDPLMSSRGFMWNAGNFWTSDVGWAIRTCSLGVRRLSHGLYCDIIGGISLFLPAYHSILGLDEETTAAPHPTTLGAPIHWVDTRLDDQSARFTTAEGFARALPAFVLAFEKCAIPELASYATEEDLLVALIDPLWVDRMKLAPSPDRRGALVALMLAKREGRDRGIAWARDDVDRIKGLTPGEKSPARWKDLRRAIEHLSE